MPMRIIHGQTASAGFALGPVCRIDHGIGTVSRTVQGPVREHALFDAAVVIAKNELEELERRAEGEQKDIIMFQRVLLDDEILVNAVGDFILSGTGSAEAVERASEMFARRLQQVDDSYIAARSTDVLDVCRRVVAILDGKPRQALNLTAPSILASEAIYPSDIISVGSGMVLGLAAAEGSSQSHASIIAQTLGIPALIHLGPDFLEDCDGLTAALDGETGRLILEPEEEELRSICEKRDAVIHHSKDWLDVLQAPGLTKDGVAFELLGNCSGPEDIEAALKQGAQGVGLLRTEFALTDRGIPSEEEQFYFYVSCLAAAGGKPLTIRTYDIGADKLVDSVGLKPSANPALGLRGLRLCLEHPELLRTQLQALLRAGARGDLRVILPMVGSEAEWDAAMAILEEAKENLRCRKMAFNEDLPVGAMIEIPSAALSARGLAARGCRSFCIGTNDLAQYTCAADRLDPLMEPYFRTDDPAVCRLVEMTVSAAKEAGIPVSVCGMDAGQPAHALRYVKMGITHLSMPAQRIMEVKRHLRESTAGG